MTEDKKTGAQKKRAVFAIFNWGKRMQYVTPCTYPNGSEDQRKEDEGGGAKCVTYWTRKIGN